MFNELPICAYLQERLSTQKFIKPTPVQAATIPPALEGKDILATAQTGTGKTLAFLLPIMQRLLAQQSDGVAALVLVPTRELAMQIVAQYDRLRGRRLLPAAQIVGGLSENAQIGSSLNIVIELCCSFCRGRGAGRPKLGCTHITLPLRFIYAENLREDKRGRNSPKS